MRIKIGDLVNHKEYGKGKVIDVNGNYPGIEFENKNGMLHNCDGKGKQNYCYWIMWEELELIKPHKFKIGDFLIRKNGELEFSDWIDNSKIIRFEGSRCYVLCENGNEDWMDNANLNDRVVLREKNSDKNSDKPKAINLRTQEEYDKCMEILEKKGWRWYSGDKPTETKYWDTYKDKFCVKYKNSMEFGNISCYKDSRDIISFKEFLQLEGHYVKCFTEDSKKNSKVKMEQNIKDFNKKNLLAGKKLAEEEKATYETTEAKKVYVSLIDRQETEERTIKVANEELVKINEELKVFVK